ncbi:MAG: YfjI family protein, partial [Arenibacterium sp.]
MTIAQPTPYADEGPQPLVREIPRGEAYPVHALGPLRDAVEAVQAATQAPAAIAAQSALSVASLVVQGHADVEGLAGSHPTSLFCLTVAQSGERKSACDKLVMQGIEDVERGQWPDYREAAASHDISLKLWASKRDRLVKEAGGKKQDVAAAAEADLRNLGVPPTAPISPIRKTSEPTLEGLIKLFQTGQPSLGLFSDEGGGFLGGHAMNSDNRLKTVAGLSKCWGGDPIDRVRAGDGASILYGRRLAMHLMVQPVAARPLLSDPVANGQGFLARFLITEPPSAIGTRLGDTGARCGGAAIDAVSARINQILLAQLPTKDESPQELEPRTLPLSQKARQLLFGYYQATEQAQAPGGELEQVRAFASKSPEQAARIAGVLALWSNLEAPEVTGPQMSDAIEIAQFYLGEAKRLSEAATVSAETERADALRWWILESWPKIAANIGRDKQNILPSDVVQYGPGSMREAATVRKLMVTLAAHGWLAPL